MKETPVTDNTTRAVDAMKAAITCLNVITYEDSRGSRWNSFLGFVDLNMESYGHVQAVIDQLRDAIDNA